MNYNEDDEIVKTKGKMYAVTALTVIFTIIIFMFVIIISIKSCDQTLTKHKYYILKVTDTNKSEVLNLLKDDKKQYCNSIFKIELNGFLTNDKKLKIYCKNEENIEFSISDNNESKIITYIYDNGKIENR